MRKIVIAASVLLFLGILALPRVACAQYSQDFEGLNGSPSGVILTGQDLYYLPNGPGGDVDFLVYTYTGNALGIVQNPAGGNQFIAGTGPGDAGVHYARAQRNVGFGANLVYTLWYDFCGIYSGAPPGSNNLGSFSLRQAANTVHINLFTWVDPNNPTQINSTYVYYDVNGVQSPIPGTPPGPEWSNMMPNHWYRCRTVIDLFANQIIEVGIRDLSGGNEAVYDPTGWYLIGGGSGFSPPDAIRFFGGGGTPGNTTAWDNMIAEELAAQGACCAPDGTCTITSQSGCQGQYQGDGTTCSPNPCPPPTGACCAPDGSCTETTQVDCHGQYLGDGTSCSPNPCTPVPTKTTTWGSIKNQYH